MSGANQYEQEERGRDTAVHSAVMAVTSSVAFSETTKHSSVKEFLTEISAWRISTASDSN